MKLSTLKSGSLSQNKTVVWLLFLLVFVAMVGVVYWRLPVNVDYRPGIFTIGVDWKGAYRPAALALLHGENPYVDNGFLNPPWALLPLIPVALLPQNLGAAVMFTLGFFAYGYIAYRMGLTWWAILLFLFNSMTIACLTTGSIDWLVMLGLFLPPQIGLFFLVLKPQLTVGVLLFLLVEAWRKGGWRKVLRDFAPVTLVMLLSFTPWGFWPLEVYADTTENISNASLFPMLIPVGLIWLFQALRTRDIKPAIMSSVFLTPYITYHGYAVAFLGLDSLLVVIATLSVWVMPYLR